MTTPSASLSTSFQSLKGGGRLIARLEEQEERIQELEKECSDLGQKVKGLEKWKEKMDRWMMDYFGDVLSDENSSVDEVTGGRTAEAELGEPMNSQCIDGDNNSSSSRQPRGHVRPIVKDILSDSQEPKALTDKNIHDLPHPPGLSDRNVNIDDKDNKEDNPGESPQSGVIKRERKSAVQDSTSLADPQVHQYGGRDTSLRKNKQVRAGHRMPGPRSEMLKREAKSISNAQQPETLPGSVQQPLGLDSGRPKHDTGRASRPGPLSEILKREVKSISNAQESEAQFSAGSVKPSIRPGTDCPSKDKESQPEPYPIDLMFKREKKSIVPQPEAESPLTNTRTAEENMNKQMSKSSISENSNSNKSSSSEIRSKLLKVERKSLAPEPVKKSVSEKNAEPIIGKGYKNKSSRLISPTRTEPGSSTGPSTPRKKKVRDEDDGDGSGLFKRIKVRNFKPSNSSPNTPLSAAEDSPMKENGVRAPVVYWDNDDDHVEILGENMGKHVFETSEVNLLSSNKNRVKAEKNGCTSSEEMEVDNDAPCAVCNYPWQEERNSILFCDKCNVPVHQACYGVQIIPEGKWYCNPCQKSIETGSMMDTTKLECCLCVTPGGALKPVATPAKNKWAHVLCAWWVPETTMGDRKTQEPVLGYTKILPARQKLTCTVCKSKNGWGKVQCAKGKCSTAFHLTCARKAGLKMNMNDPGGDDKLKFEAFCKQHNPKEMLA